MTALPAPDFWDDALCAQTDPDAFHPDQGESSHVRQAKAVCRRCHVVERCLAWALDNDTGHGIYGGTTARERRNLRNQQEAAA